MSPQRRGYGWLWRSRVGAVLLGTCLVAAQDRPVEERASEEASEEAIVKAEKALAAKEFAAALPLLKELTAQEPKNDRAWFNLAYTYTMLGEHPEAISAYRRTLALRPQFAEASLNLGILLLEQEAGGRGSPAPGGSCGRPS